MINIKWHGENEVPKTAIDQTVTELEELLEKGLPAPHKLIFHHVFLGENIQDGPLVFAWGDPDEPDVFQCEYMTKPQWRTLNEVDTPDEGDINTTLGE